MKELPSPTFALSPRSPRHLLFRPRRSIAKVQDSRLLAVISSMPEPQIRFPQHPAASGSPAKLTMHWIVHQDEVREAQRLRYQVFAQEMGATLKGPLPGHDIDRFDDFCEHLLVRDAETGEAVGTYRVLTPAQARRAGGLYSDAEFDLSRLQHLRPNMVELGRSCVHADYRTGPVIMMLWRALADFMLDNRLDTMIGCASIPMQHSGLPSGHAAASIWEQVRTRYMADAQYHVTPHLPLPVDALHSNVQVDPPALIKGYLRLGTKVLGPPAWDPEFHAADLPMMLRVADLSPRYRQHFMRE